jgi:hypothetical protein
MRVLVVDRGFLEERFRSLPSLECDSREAGAAAVLEHQRLVQVT